MNHALALNAAILMMIAIAIVATGSPLPLLGLMYLGPLPFGLVQSQAAQETGEEESTPMGFHS